MAGFLTNSGLAHFYSRLKEIFARSVNNTTPDSHGNIQINQVPLAENLTSPDAQASVDTFVYRTSGGAANLESGEANLVFINGNMTITDRVAEEWSYTSTNDIICNIDDINKEDWRSSVITSGNTTFTYSVEIDDSNVTEWVSEGTWSPSLNTYGLATAITNVINYEINCEITATGISSATVNPTTFNASSLGNTSGTYEFIYAIDEEENTFWSLDSNEISLLNYGITITGTPNLDDKITITWVNGTPTNSTVTISYVVPNQGTLNIATPKTFFSTGFNQFDIDNMRIDNATISNNSIISNTGTYICYCPAKGGDHGYAAVSPGNHIVSNVGMAWCANTPSIGSSVVTTSTNINDAVTSFSGRFTYNDDGYILVVMDNNGSDLMMGCAWTDYISDIQEELQKDPSFYVPYSTPSWIPIPTYYYDDNIINNLPTNIYGLPKIGTYYDTINFDANTYIQRVGHYPYSAENLAIVEDYYDTYGTPYDYDNNNIFYALDGNQNVGSPIIYNLSTQDSAILTRNGVVKTNVVIIDFTKFRNNAVLSKTLRQLYNNTVHDHYKLICAATTEPSKWDWYDGNTKLNETPVNAGSWLSLGTNALQVGDELNIYLKSGSIYQVDDHGTERFRGTSVGVEAELLYGQNLRDKLRTDVVTISPQELTTAQKNQVCNNINAVKKTGDTITGNLIVTNQLNVNMSDPAVVLRSTTADSTVTPSANISHHGYWMADKNGQATTILRDAYYTNGNVGAYICGIRKVNGANTYNGLSLQVSPQGDRKVTFTERDPWLEALGLTVTSTSTISSIITPASGITISSFYYAQWGKIAQVWFLWSRSSAIEVTAKNKGNLSNILIGTLVSGKRPKINSALHSNGDYGIYETAGGEAWYTLSTTGELRLGAIQYFGSAYTVPANTQFVGSGTFILA